MTTSAKNECNGRNRARLSFMRTGAAPGRCADCGSDAYIQLAVGDAMVCAHCYQDRLGPTKKAIGRKGGERVVPRPASILPRPS
jgi:hypothetical protein